MLGSYFGSGSLMALHVISCLDFIQPCPYLGGVKPYRGGFFSFCKMEVLLFELLGSLIKAFYGGESSYGGGHTSDRGGVLVLGGSQVLWKVPSFVLSFEGWLHLGDIHVLRLGALVLSIQRKTQWPKMGIAYDLSWQWLRMVIPMLASYWFGEPFKTPLGSMVGGAIQNPFELVLCWRVVYEPGFCESSIFCLASCIMVKRGLLFFCLTLVSMVGGAIHNPKGNGLSGVVPWLLRWFFLYSGFFFLHLLSSSMLSFEVEDLIEVDAQPIEVASSCMVEAGRSSGGLDGHCWRFTTRPVHIESFILCWAGCEKVVRGAVLSPPSLSKVGGAFQNPCGLVLFWKVVYMPVNSDRFIFCLARSIMMIGGLLSSWLCVLPWPYLPILVQQFLWMVC
jgi:hypothetical protein